MRLFNLNDHAEGLMFDLDMTLYRHVDYYRSQTKNQVILLAQRLSLSVEGLESRLERWRHDFAEAHQGRQPSFGNTLLGALGISIEESVALRREAIRPEDYLQPDPRLHSVLGELSQRFKLVLVTNNPSDVAIRTLKVLGVGEFFERCIGLDQAGESKPAPSAFRLALEALACKPESVVSIGDRWEVDLELPVSWGCGGVLVESMDDVYSLPDILLGAAKS